MATQSTMNTWLDELALSILPKQSSPQAIVLQDRFKKSVKRHNYARTNQFAVEEHLNGLEEKFQLLSLDGLADALHQRRDDLYGFEQSWLPDVLDFLLRMTGNPAKKDQILKLYGIPAKASTPPLLRWKDIIRDDPDGRDHDIWKVPSFRSRQDSLDDSQTDSSSISGVSATSASSLRSVVPGLLSDNVVPQAVQDMLQGYRDSVRSNVYNELDMIRQMLQYVQGHGSQLFADVSHITNGDVEFCSSLSSACISAVMSEVVRMREFTDVLRNWISAHPSEAVVQCSQNVVAGYLTQFDSSVNDQLVELLTPTSPRVWSLLQIIDTLKEAAGRITIVASALAPIREAESADILQHLYTRISDAQTCNDSTMFEVLVGMMIPALRVYLEPLGEWISYGIITRENRLVQKNGNSQLADLWHSLYTLSSDRHDQLPQFLIPYTQQILDCGKSASFLQYVSSSTRSGSRSTLDSLENLLSQEPSIAMPFCPLLDVTIQSMLDTALHEHTLALRTILNTLGFGRLFRTIDVLYLGAETTFQEGIEFTLFEQIDICNDLWNDRHTVAEIIEQTCSRYNMGSIFDNTRIVATARSSRPMRDRRKSVRILAGLRYEIILDWPIANIIRPSTILSYQKISLILSQLRRAKYMLERRVYTSVMSQPIAGADSADQAFAQILCRDLLTFVNTFYNHMTSTVIQPTTQQMRARMKESRTIDMMIKAHADYILNLEDACLSSRRRVTQRECLVKILDLCIRFSDLVTGTKSGEDTSEAGSFRSAQVGNDSDSDDNDVEGYSSFIVLEEGTSTMHEIRKLRRDVTRQLKLLITDLVELRRCDYSVDDFGLLERIEWFAENFR